MKFRIVLSPGANVDFNSIVLWYLNIDPELASRFIVEVDVGSQRIKRMPYAFPIYSGPFRRARLKRFPYWIYYYITPNVVVVSAILHQSRSDPPWLTRANERR